MENISERLKKEIMICDGAMGTELVSQGLKSGELPDIWNLTHPEIVKNIHKLYKEAGADILITNTFGSNRLNLKRHNLADKIQELTSMAVKLAKEIAKGDCFIFGDVGPSGQLIKPLGDVEYNEAYDNFLEQISMLKESGVDAIIIETMTDLQELKAAVSAAKSFKDVLVVGCMAFGKTKKGFRTVMGVSIEQAVSLMKELNCDIIGSNCGVGIDEMTEIVSLMRKLTDKFLIAQPNAGQPRFIEGKTVFNQTPLDFKKKAKGLIKAGANIMGGCCGTTPEHIKQLTQFKK